MFIYLALPPSPSLLPPLSPVSPLPLTPHPSPPPPPLPSHTHTDSASRTDYTAVDTELTFQQGGSRRLCTSVPIVNDNIVENNETLTVTLSTKNASVTSPTATVTILDDIDGMYILLCMLCVHACKLLSFSTLSLSLPPSLSPWILCLPLSVLYIRPPIPVINIVEDYGVLLLCILIAGERERNFNVGFKFNDDSAQGQ